MPDYRPARILILGCVFQQKGPLGLLVNSIAGREVIWKTSACRPRWNEIEARVMPGSGRVQIESDLPGLRKQARAGPVPLL